MSPDQYDSMVNAYPDLLKALKAQFSVHGYSRWHPAAKEADRLGREILERLGENNPKLADFLSPDLVKKMDLSNA